MRCWRVKETDYCMKAAFSIIMPLMLILAGCCSDVQKKRIHAKVTNPGNNLAGGFWEGSESLMPSYYYGFTFVEWNGQLIGTCFQGGKDGVRLYHLEECTIQGNHFAGWKSYHPFNVSERIEGTISGNSCRIVEYDSHGRGVINLHRVAKLSRRPNVFLEAQKGRSP